MAEEVIHLTLGLALFLTPLSSPIAQGRPAPPEVRTVELPSPMTRVSRTAVDPTSVWDRLAQCESNGNWQANTGNGFYGGLQFLPSTWRAVGGTGLPHEHTREEQIRRAQILLNISWGGWHHWPACSRKLGLR